MFRFKGTLNTSIFSSPNDRIYGFPCFFDIVTSVFELEWKCSRLDIRIKLLSLFRSILNLTARCSFGDLNTPCTIYTWLLYFPFAWMPFLNINLQKPISYAVILFWRKIMFSLRIEMCGSRQKQYDIVPSHAVACTSTTTEQGESRIYTNL